MRRSGTSAALAVLTALCLALLPCREARAQAAGQQILNDAAMQRVFYVQCQGTVGEKSFTGVRMQLIVAHAPEGSRNPFEIVMESTPALAQRNTAYWNSGETEMDVLADTVRCRLKPRGASQADMHFFYMSPALYRSALGPTHRDQERIAWVDKNARPIKVVAQDAEITIRFGAGSVSGTIRITGQDPLARKPVRYQASFQGQEYFYARPAPQ